MKPEETKELQVLEVKLTQPTHHQTKKAAVKYQVIGMTGKTLNTSPIKEKPFKISQRNKERSKVVIRGRKRKRRRERRRRDRLLVTLSMPNSMTLAMIISEQLRMKVPVSSLMTGRFSKRRRCLTTSKMTSQRLGLERLIEAP